MLHSDELYMRSQVAVGVSLHNVQLACSCPDREQYLVARASAGPFHSPSPRAVNEVLKQITDRIFGTGKVKLIMASN